MPAQATLVHTIIATSTVEARENFPGTQAQEEAVRPARQASTKPRRDQRCARPAEVVHLAKIAVVVRAAPQEVVFRLHVPQACTLQDPLARHVEAARLGPTGTDAAEAQREPAPAAFQANTKPRRDQRGARHAVVVRLARFEKVVEAAQQAAVSQ